MNHDGSTFACGCAATIDAIFCAKELDDLVEQGRDNCHFVVWFANAWYKYNFAGAWPAIAMATIKPPGRQRTVVAVSQGGAYFEVEPKSLNEAHGAIKKAKYPLRSLAAIKDVVYACGMGRSVLSRGSAGSWDEIGPGQSEEDEGLVIGFEDLDGFSADEMYAVGWRGEIWRRAKATWLRLDSPVSANLNAVACASDGQVYVVGDGGILVRGRNNVWQVLETDVSSNLMDVAVYDDTTYLVTDFQILKLEDDVVVPETAFSDPGDVPATCLHLLSAPDGLISLGTKDLFRLRGGVWERLV